MYVNIYSEHLDIIILHNFTLQTQLCSYNKSSITFNGLKNIMRGKISVLRYVNCLSRKTVKTKLYKKIFVYKRDRNICNYILNEGYTT